MKCERKLLKKKLEESGKKKRKIKKKDWVLTGMAVPSVLMLLVLNYFPMAGLILAFKDYRYNKGFLGSEWVGFKNFEFFFKSNDAWIVLRNTIGLNLMFITVTLVIAVSIALILNEVRSRAVVKTVQTIMFFPYFISWVVASYLVYAYLAHNYGILNTFLANAGKETVKWYMKAEYWPLILTIVYIWKNAGYNAVIYYAAMMGIDKTYYEAAELDGANRWQMAWHITLPGIKTVIIVMLILAIGRVMYADTGLFFQVTKDTGALYATTDVLDTYILRSLRINGDIGISSAVGCFQAVVGFLLVVISNEVVKRIDYDSRLF